MSARSTGLGTQITANATGTIVEYDDAVRKVSIYNKGANSVYAQVNSSVAALLAAMGDSEAVEVPAGASFVFDSLNPKGEINSLVVACTSGQTSAISVGAY